AVGDQAVEPMRVGRDGDDPFVADGDGAIHRAVFGHRVDRPRSDDLVGQADGAGVRRTRSGCLAHAMPPATDTRSRIADAITAASSPKYRRGHATCHTLQEAFWKSYA